MKFLHQPDFLLPMHIGFLKHEKDTMSMTVLHSSLFLTLEQQSACLSAALQMS